MLGVVADVSIGCNAQTQLYDRIYHHELGSQHLFAPIVLIKHAQPVVTAHLQSALRVGYLQLVVGIEHVGVERVHVVVYLLVVEAHQPVAFKERLCGRPVGFAMLQMSHETMVAVRQFVETDVQHVAASQFHNRHRHPFIVDNHLKGLHVGRQYLVLGCSLQTGD